MTEQPRSAGRLRVLASSTVTPRMLRLTASVVEEHLPFDPSCPNLVVRLSLPVDNREEEIASHVGAAHISSARPPSRTYTIRRYDRAAGVVDIDVVLHGDGPFVRWARTAGPGETIEFTGPRPHAVPSFDASLIMVGDESGLPAVASILESAPSALSITALVEVADSAEEQQVETAAKLDLRWLHRDGAPAGTTGALERAVRGLAWPDDDVQVWVAGETSEVRAIRRFVSAERGVGRESLHAFGYWRRGRSGDVSGAERS